MSKLKSAPPQEFCQLNVNLRHAFAPDGMALRHVAAKRVWRHKFQLQTHRRSPRIQHLKPSPIGNPLFAARKNRLNILNRLVQYAHKNQWGTPYVTPADTRRYARLSGPNLNHRVERAVLVGHVVLSSRVGYPLAIDDEFVL